MGRCELCCPVDILFLLKYLWQKRDLNSFRKVFNMQLFFFMNCTYIYIDKNSGKILCMNTMYSPWK